MNKETYKEFERHVGFLWTSTLGIRDSHAIKLMANLTERNGLVLSYEPSLCPHFQFFFFLQFDMFLICFVLFLFLLIFQADTKQFIFVSFNCWKFNFTYFSHNYDYYSMFRDVPECSGMFRNVPCSGFNRRPKTVAFFKFISSC